MFISVLMKEQETVRETLRKTKNISLLEFTQEATWVKS